LGNRSIQLSTARDLSQSTWAAGDFSLVAASNQIVSELLCEAIPLRAGQRVLDVATGSGNTALAATRRATEVVGVDFVPALLDRARERAHAERARKVTFEEGDTENLPFPDASFDVVLSTYGHMFAPDPARAAQEMIRVCRPGGHIGFAAWTPQGLFGKVFDLHDKYNPPPEGSSPVTRWGDEEFVRERFGSAAQSFRFERRDRIFRALSVEQWFGFISQYLGPTVVTMERLDEPKRQAFKREMIGLMEGANQSGDETLFAPAEYLEAVIKLR